MKLIAHRGNLSGKNPDFENAPNYISEALLRGFDVEADVRICNGEIWLGHNSPDYQVNIDFLKNEHMWCHAKTIETLDYLLDEGVHCFYHDEDDCTLTSKGYIWTYPCKRLVKKSIYVLPERCLDYFTYEISGICSDNIIKYCEILK